MNSLFTHPFISWGLGTLLLALLIIGAQIHQIKQSLRQQTKDSRNLDRYLQHLRDKHHQHLSMVLHYLANGQKRDL
ncbi:MAG: hypothetical protein AAF587_34230 [Bacteroidota bacterium]